MRRRNLLIIILLLVFLTGIYSAYRLLFGSGIRIKGERTVLFIPTGSTYEAVMDSLKAHLTVDNMNMLDWVARKKNYPSNIKPGKYLIERNISYIGLINILRSGSQEPVNVTFNNIRYLRQLAGRVGGQIEADSAQIAAFLTDRENYSKDGFTPEDVISVFIPNTYRFNWNTSAEGFYSRMLREYNKFWNPSRSRKADDLGLTREEVAILASIVDDEVAKSEEKPKIAGVYLNRLKRGIPLQACPTIKFALNDFTISRVLTKHLQVDSPYNTYKHRGFPPGPIGCPTIEGIDAVLNAEKHDYLYFAAKADFSGYHNFSRTLAEHNRYAAEYQRELDRRRIYK